MSGVTAITLGNQTAIAGITVPVTVTTSTPTKPNFVSAVFSDVVFNTNRSVTVNLNNFIVGDASNVWHTEAVLSETDMAILFPDNDFKKNVKLIVSKQGVNAVKTDLKWLSLVDILSITAVPGTQKIYMEFNINDKYDYSNDNLYAQLNYVVKNSLAVGGTNVSIPLVQKEGETHVYTCELTGLVIGNTLEIQAYIENNHGVSNIVTLPEYTVGYTPSNGTIESFDSLDVSGAKFGLKVGPHDYSTYNSLDMVLEYRQGNLVVGQETISIDICGTTNPNLSSSQAYVFNHLMGTNNKQAIQAGNQFSTTAYLIGKHNVNGTEQAFNGRSQTRTFWMDQNMSAPVVTLDAIDWVDGTQTIKAVFDGCFNNVTFSFDLSGSVSDVTSYDICGATQKMTVIKEYNYSEIGAVGKAIKVKATRPELNGAASVSVSPNTALGFNLKQIKRAAAPTVSTGAVDRVASTVTFTFSAIPDVSFSDVYADISGATEYVSGASVRDISGNATIVLDANFDAGTYNTGGYTRYDLQLAQYNARYIQLNNNQNKLLSAKNGSSFSFTGVPTITLSVRPASANGTLLNVVRLSGDMNANNVQKILCIARDVSGDLVQRELAVDANTVDSCGNNLSGSTVEDNARQYAHDFVFPKEIDLGANMFLLGIVDTPSSFDAIEIKTDVNLVSTSPDVAAVAFKEAVINSSAATLAYNAALDLSNNPTNNTEYNTLNTLVNNIDASVNTLTTDISNAIILRDSSNNGGLWFKDGKNADHQSKIVLANIATANFNTITALINAYDASYAALPDAASKADLQNFGSVSFQKQVFDAQIDPSYVTVTVTGTGLSADSFERKLDVLLGDNASGYTNVYFDAIAARNAAQVVYNNALIAYNNNLASITTKSAERTDLQTLKTSTQSSMSTMKAGFVTAAKTAKNGKDLADEELAVAREAFYHTQA